MLRRWLRSVVLQAIEPKVREWIREAQAPAAPDVGPKLAELDEKHAKLEKKVSMAMGAVQAATAQLMTVKQAAEQAANHAQQAMQRATSAQAAAEAAADGVAALEAKPAKRSKKAAPEGVS